MRIDAVVTSQGAFIPVIVSSDEITTKKPIFFLIDIGATHTIISVIDIDENFDCSSLKDGSKATGVGGFQQCFLINNVSLYFLTNTSKWVKGKQYKTLDVLPIIYQENKNKPIRIPSLLGRDIIGNDFKLFYGKDKIFLK